MKNGRYFSPSVLCFAYKYESRNEISCMGPAENVSYHTAFGNSKEKLAYRHYHCCSPDEARRCPLYATLKTIYGDEP